MITNAYFMVEIIGTGNQYLVTSFNRSTFPLQIIAIIGFFSGDKSSNYLIKFKIQTKQITIL